MQRQHHSKSLQEYYYRQRKHSVIYTGGLTHTQEHTGHKFRQTGTPVVDSHMVSDKSPMAYLRVQMAPPICLFNTKGMRRMKCANSPPPPSPFKCHFGCIPNVRDVIHQTARSRRQLHKHDRDFCQDLRQ